MSEENLDLSKELEEAAAKEVEEATGDAYSDEEVRAMDDGWRPETEWEGESQDWIGAKEFNFRGELMTRISSQTSKLADQDKKLKDVSSALQILGEHHKKTSETEHKRILKALKREKSMAMEEGDAETVTEIDDKIYDLKESKKEEEAQYKESKKEEEAQSAEGVPPEVKSWMEDATNDWYHTDPVRKGIADAVSNDYLNKHPGASLTDMLKHVDKVVRQEMPHKFSNGKVKARSNVTESQSSSRSKSTKFTAKDLDEDQKQAAKTFVGMGVFDNVQQYVDELVSNGDLA